MGFLCCFRDENPKRKSDRSSSSSDIPLEDIQQTRPIPSSIASVTPNTIKHQRSISKPLPPPNPRKSYAEAIVRAPTGKVEAEEARECRKLLREVYALNVYIANLGFVHEVNKPIVEAKKTQAASGIADLIATIESWAANVDEWTEQERNILYQINDRMEELKRSHRM